MVNKILFLVAFLFSKHSYGQQKKVDSFFCGKWINTQYEYTLKYEPNAKGTSSITPYRLVIDSFGLCTIMIRFEQKSSAGKPIKQKSFGPIKQLTYKHWGEMYLTQVPNSDSLMAVSSKNTGMSILFRKVH
jgi:hypothetical protein